MSEDIFYYLNGLYNKKIKQPDDSEVSSFVYQINRFLSMDKDLLETIAETTRYLFTLGPKYYKLLWRIIPLSNAQRNKYVKVDKIGSELVDRYKQYFRLSRREVIDYIRILEKQYSTKEIYAFVGLEGK